MEEKDYTQFESVLDASITDDEFELLFKHYFHFEDYTMENYIEKVKNDVLKYRHLAYLYTLRKNDELAKFFSQKSINVEMKTRY